MKHKYLVLNPLFALEISGFDTWLEVREELSKQEEHGVGSKETQIYINIDKEHQDE